MRTFNFIAAALVAGFVLPANAADITQSGFSPLYLGVDFETATVPSNATAASTPTTSRAYVARIDLKAPGIAFITTPHSGVLNTTAETISQFAVDQHVRLAINANFFAPCCNAAAEPKTVIGLLVSRGVVVSPPTSDPLQSEAVIAISRENHAVIAQAPDVHLSNVFTAVAGSAIIVKDGEDGGSTEMVRADEVGVPYIVNNPSGGAERFDAAAFGVYALPLLSFPF
jgi:hypothetical protein